MNLTDEEIRIKVAEAMGWEPSKEIHGCWRNKHDGLTLPSRPNYPESLDACAEFEATLTINERLAFRNLLVRAQAECPYPDAYAVSATPLQRCLAYLKTKGTLP